MTPGHHCLVAARVWGLDWYAKNNADKTSKNGEALSLTSPSLRQVAKQFNCTQRDIICARDLLFEAPALAQEVEAGLPLRTLTSRRDLAAGQWAVVAARALRMREDAWMPALGCLYNQ
jgi:hypothetical protein